MAVEHKDAAGTLPDRQHLETALSQLKAANFPMHNVSVVAQHGDSNEATLNPSEPTVQSEAQFARHRTIKRIEHGALDAGSWGGVVGILGAELVTLAVPGVGSLLLAVEAASGGPRTNGTKIHVKAKTLHQQAFQKAFLVSMRRTKATMH